MVVQSAQAAIDNANAQSNCDPGYCLKYTRTWLGIGSKEADAADAWRNAIGKHPDDKHPPKGAPVFWLGGTNGHGHIALAKADSMRSTDIPQTGTVGNDDGRWPREHWGLEYVGWAEGFNGVRIPWLGDDWRASGDVYVSKLKQGVTESDSVARLRYRLENHPEMQGSGHKPGLGNGYGQECLEAVRYWQRNIAPSVDGPDNGESMSNAQANQLFGDNYTVHEK